MSQASTSPEANQLTYHGLLPSMCVVRVCCEAMEHSWMGGPSALLAGQIGRVDTIFHHERASDPMRVV